MNVAFRVDASSEMGTGHLARCLTLGQRLIEKGARVRFVSRHAPLHLQDAVRAVGADFHLIPPQLLAPDQRLGHAAWLGVPQAVDAAATRQALADQSFDWLIVDHYALDAEWETSLRPSATKIAAIDDLADRSHDCDLLVDPNLDDEPAARYRGRLPGHCRALLGPAYALLRPEFARLRANARPRSGEVRRVLVFFGGVDAANHTTMAIEALMPLRDRISVDIVIGAGHAARTEIERSCAALGFRLHVQTPDMARLAAAADLAIGVGGVALWERCCVGLPAITFVSAFNHAAQVEHASRAGLVHAPNPSSPSAATIALHIQALCEAPGLRQLLSSRAMAAVDGQGVARVARVLLGAAIGVRRANCSDSERVREWRNHESVRAVSRHAEPIDPVQHDRWFNSVCNDPSRVLLIGEIEGDAFGVVRFDIVGASAEVSIYLAPGRQGAGLGPSLLAAAEDWLCRERSEIEVLTAEVLGGNARSERLFTGCGYTRHTIRFSKQVRRS